MSFLETVFPCFSSERYYYDEIKDINDEPARPVHNEKASRVESSCVPISHKSASLTLKSNTGYVLHPLPPSIDGKRTDIDEEKRAGDILSLLYTADDLDALRKEFRPTGWTNTLARRILDGLVDALNAGAAMGGAMKEAFDKASAEAKRFVEEHPVLTAVIVTVIAIGILQMMVPWAVAALGFGELGPIEGSFAAWWQSTYPNVPYSSLFAFLQRLGMTLGK